MYESLNGGNWAGFVAMWTPDAALHGGDGMTVSGAGEIGKLISELREATGGTLRWELHDALANDEHGVALHITRAELAGRSLTDNVVYVFHIRDGKVAKAWFNGDPRIQAAFYSVTDRRPAGPSVSEPAAG
jgi:hypothetical protein